MSTEKRLAHIERAQAYQTLETDLAMEEAQRIYFSRKAGHDPYAMHKAVESLPVHILARILADKLEAEIKAQRMREAPTQEILPDLAEYLSQQLGVEMKPEDILHVKRVKPCHQKG
jgi:hypothetical protein